MTVRNWGDDSESQKRTGVVTALCLVGFLGAALSVPVALSPEARAVGDWYPVFVGWAALASLVCVLGMWHMRRWGVYLYILFAAANQLVMLYTGGWQPLDLLVPAVFAGAALSQAGRMR